MLAELSIIAGYTVIACPVPFPVVVVAYAAVGFGEALQIAYNNVSQEQISGCERGLSVYMLGLHRQSSQLHRHPGYCSRLVWNRRNHWSHNGNITRYCWFALVPLLCHCFRYSSPEYGVGGLGFLELRERRQCAILQ